MEHLNRVVKVAIKAWEQMSPSQGTWRAWKGHENVQLKWQLRLGSKWVQGRALGVLGKVTKMYNLKVGHNHTKWWAFQTGILKRSHSSSWSVIFLILLEKESMILFLTFDMNFGWRQIKEWMVNRFATLLQPDLSTAAPDNDSDKDWS